MSFRTGMKLQLAWSLFWMFCWYMTCQFMFTGEYNDFNNGGIVTKSVPIILFCTLLTFVAVILTAMYLYKDTVGTRLGLVVASGTLFVVAVVFVFGGVPIMIIDIVAMGYALMKTWYVFVLILEFQFFV